MLLFVFQTDYFDVIGENVHVSDDKKTIRKDKSAPDNWLNTSYGKTVILSTSRSIVTWKIKCDYLRNACIGITSSTNCQSDDFSVMDDSFLYAIVVQE